MLVSASVIFGLYRSGEGHMPDENGEETCLAVSGSSVAAGLVALSRSEVAGLILVFFNGSAGFVTE